MSPEAQAQAERMGFREWTDHYEKEQETQRDQIAELTKAVSALTADVRTLVDNQRGLFSRINRPQPVAAYVSALLASIAVMISFSTLLVSPIKESVAHMAETHLLDTERNLQLHVMMKEDIEQNQITNATNAEALRWIEKLEDRYNTRLHMTIGEN